MTLGYVRDVVSVVHVNRAQAESTCTCILLKGTLTPVCAFYWQWWMAWMPTPCLCAFYIFVSGTKSSFWLFPPECVTVWEKPAGEFRNFARQCGFGAKNFPWLEKRKNSGKPKKFCLCTPIFRDREKPVKLWGRLLLVSLLRWWQQLKSREQLSQVSRSIFWASSTSRAAEEASGKKMQSYRISFQDMCVNVNCTVWVSEPRKAQGWTGAHDPIVVRGRDKRS